MKKLIAALIVLGAIYNGAWFYGAHNATAYTNEKWDELVEQADEKGFVLSKKSSSISGFPLGYTLTIVSPSLQEKAGENAKGIYSSIDGALRIKSNLLGTRYTVESSGDQHYRWVETEQNLEKMNHYILSGDLSLAFDLPRKSFIEGVREPFKALMEEDPTDVGSGDFVRNDSVLHVKNLKLIDADIPTLSVFEMDKGYLEATYNDRSDDEQRITLDGDFRGFDMLFGGSESYTPSETRSLQEIAVMLSIPKAGKTDISFSLDLTGSLDRLAQLTAYSVIADGIPPFTFKLKSFKTSNDFANSYGEGKVFAKKMDDNGQKFHFSVKSITEVSEKQEVRFREQWENFLNNLPICDGKFHSDVCVSAKNIVPSWNKQGKLVTHVDVDYDLKNRFNPLAGSTLVIHNFDLHSDLYGLKSHGDVILNDSDPAKATYLVELPNYEYFVKDLFKYFNGIRGLFPALAPELVNMPPLNEDQFEITADFLRSISDHPEQKKDDLSITFQARGWDNVKVGTVSFGEFTEKLNQFMQQFNPDKNPIQPESP